MSLSDLFSTTRRVCPFCLATIKLKRHEKACSDCERQLPPLYLDSRPLPPAAIQVFGWPGHGKTVYLLALTMMLTRMSRVWRRAYSYLPINDGSQQRVQAIEESIASGLPPAPTSKGTDESFVMLLSGMEPWGGRMLMIRDSPGEAFESMQVPIGEAPFLLRAPITFMFVSLSDLRPGRAMNDLLAIYLGALSHHGVSVKRQRRKLVVVLTKADLLPQLPPAIVDYLRYDPLWETIHAIPGTVGGRPPDALRTFDWTTYREGMQRASDWLVYWLQLRTDGPVFLQLAKASNVELRFTAISSTGSGIARGSQAVQWEPHRVLDPFFWALDLAAQAGT